MASFYKVVRAVTLRSSPKGILQYAGKAIKFYNLAYVKYFGEFTMTWEAKPVKLNAIKLQEEDTSKLRLPLLVFLNLIGMIIHAIITGFYCLMWDNPKINYVIKMILFFSMCIALGLSYLGLKMFRSSGEIAGAFNGMVELYLRLNLEYPKAAKEFEQAWKKILPLSGLVLNLTVQGMLTCHGCVIAGMLLGFDSFYYLYDEVDWNDETSDRIFFWLATAFRIFCNLCTGQFMARFACFILIYYYVTLFSYFSITYILKNRLDINLDNFLTDYRQLIILHYCGVNRFIKHVNGAILFIGHTSGVAFFWVGMKGWDHVPHFMVIFIVYSGVVLTVLIIALLTVYSRISESTEETLWEREIVVAMKSRKWHGIYRRENKALKGIVFTIFNFNAVDRDSPVDFAMTLLDNLISAVMTF